MSVFFFSFLPRCGPPSDARCFHTPPPRSAPAASSRSGDQGQASTAVVNYTYFDTARRDTVIPIHKKKSLSAADVMKPGGEPS